MHYTCKPKFSYISLDYKDGNQSILSGEYRCGTARAKGKACPGTDKTNSSCHDKTPKMCKSQYTRLVRWPMDKSTGRLVTNENGIVIAEGAWYAGAGDVQGANSYTENGKTTFFLNGTYYDRHGLIVSGVGANAKYKRFYDGKDWGNSPEGMYITTKDSIWTATEKTGSNKYGSYKRVIFYVNRKDFMP